MMSESARTSSILLVLPCLLLLGTQSPAQAQSRQAPVSGSVFLDHNGNGLLDQGEPGLPGIGISNQLLVVPTGTDGGFELAGPGMGVIFVIPPEDFACADDCWKAVSPDAASSMIDFPLVRSELGSSFSFIHASDVHLSEETLPRLRQVREIVERQRPAFVLMTGDLVHDALRVDEAEARSYYELFLREIAAFPVPVWTVPGNHEIFGIERHLSLVSPEHPLYGKSMYRHFLGPDYYSFNAGGIHFVGLDTVDIDDLWYFGHVDEAQLEWLRQDLAATPENTPIVVFSHIPFVTAGDSLYGYSDEPPAPTLLEVDGVTSFRHVVSNASEALTLLRQRSLEVALAGHGHFRETLVYETDGVRTRFHNASSVRNDSEGAGMTLLSGITLYQVDNGVIDDGTFVRLP